MDDLSDSLLDSSKDKNRDYNKGLSYNISFLEDFFLILTNDSTDLNLGSIKNLLYLIILLKILECFFKSYLLLCFNKF